MKQLLNRSIRTCEFLKGTSIVLLLSTTLYINVFTKPGSNEIYYIYYYCLRAEQLAIIICHHVKPAQL